MSRRPSAITQADVARAVKGAQAGGLAVTRIEIEGGKLTVHTTPLPITAEDVKALI